MTTDSPAGTLSNFQARHRRFVGQVRGAVRGVGTATLFGPAAHLIFGVRNRHVRDIAFSALRASRARFFCVDGPNESLLVNCRDDIISRAVFRSGSFDFHKFERAVAALRDGGLVEGAVERLYDVGANIGTICVPAVARGLARTAVAVEAHPLNCRLLRANVALNGLDAGIAVVEAAAGAEDGGVVELEVNERNWGDHRVAPRVAAGGVQGEAARPRIPVPMQSIDAIAARHGPPTLLWMDTQGFEGFVLAGASQALAGTVPVATEYWPYSLRRVGGYEAFHTAVGRYRRFVDLDAGGPAHPVAEFEARYAGLAVTEGADLLFLP